MLEAHGLSIDRRKRTKTKIDRKAVAPETSQVESTAKSPFLRPVLFNGDVTNCSFHPTEAPFFGLFGNKHTGIENVSEQDSPKNEGTDVKDECPANDLPPTTCCQECTTRYLMIATCPAHKISTFPRYTADTSSEIEALKGPRFGNDSRVFNELALLASFHAITTSDPQGQQAGKLAWQTTWCSICPAPAEYSCCAHDADDDETLLPEVVQVGSMVQGCGLHLCACCEDLFTKLLLAEQQRASWMSQAGKDASTDGKLDVMRDLVSLAGSGSRAYDYPYGLRADVGFLLEDGELLRKLGQEV